MPTPDHQTRFPFSEASIRDWPCPEKGRIRLRDTKCPGLMCYVSPVVRDGDGVACNNPKAFYYRARVNGSLVEMKLGNWPTLTIEEARKKVKAQIAPDPTAAADARRAVREESTLAELWDWFKRHHLPTLRETSRRRYEDSWRLHIEPRLGSRQLSNVKRSDVQALADSLVDSGENRGKNKHGGPARKCGGKAAARHVCAVLSAMYFAAKKDDALHYHGDIPTIGMRRPKVASRARFLQPGELPAFLKALSEEPEPWRLFWTCCLFVGLRRGNVASARWADLALDIGQWLVPEERSKNGAMLAVPIPTPVLASLKAWKAELPGLLMQANESRRRLLSRGDAGVRERLPVMTDAELATAGRYLFPSALVPGKPTTSPHIVDPKASWRRLLIRAKLADLRPHDLRRSIGSWMALGGVGLPIIGAALGHKDQRSTAVYARLNDSAVRTAMNRATDAMLAAGADPGITLGMSDISDRTHPEDES